MKQITIEWKGETLVIGEDEAFELGEQIEEIVTFTELISMQAKPKFHKLSRCYAVMIVFAGGYATPKEVHSMMMAQIKDKSQKALLVTEAVGTLISILMDGAPEEDGGDEEEGEKKDSSKAAT